MTDWRSGTIQVEVLDLSAHVRVVEELDLAASRPS
jgi:hypothetical protein